MAKGPTLLARLGAAARLVLTGGMPDGWFGPQEPLAPLAPAEVEGRRWDYPTAINLVSKPRGEPGEDGITFEQLRALSRGYDLLRLVIETRKDQLARLDWAIQARDPAQRKATDSRIGAVTRFLERPDRENAWGDWLRMLVEDMLVIGAATLYPRRTRAGALYALDAVDGGTIKVVIDDWGRTAGYQQFLKGVPAVDYGLDDILYFPRNRTTDRLYALSPVEQVVMTVNIALRRQLHQMQYYTEGNIPEALIGVPDNWTPDQIQWFQEYWDGMLEGNTAERRHAKFVPGAIAKSMILTKAEALKDDYDEWLARIICYAFSVSNQWAVKQMNRATAETAQDLALQEGLAPLQAWVKGMVDRCLAVGFGWPDLEFTWAEEEELDPAAQNAIVDTKVKSGRLTLDEARAMEGLDPYPDGIGAEPLIYTAAGAVRLRDVVKPPQPAPAMLGHRGGAAGPGQPSSDGDEDEQPLAKAAKPHLAPAIHRLRRHWAAFLAEEAPRVANRVGHLMAGRLHREGLDKGADGEPDSPQGGQPVSPDAVDAAVEVGAWEAAARDAEPIITAVTQDGVALGADAAVEGSADTDLAAAVTEIAAQSVIRANPQAVAYAAGRSAELVGGLTDTTRAALRALVARAEAEGWSMEKLQRAIIDDFGFSARRAWMIAKTEVRRADVAGHLANWRAMRDLGARLRKRWVVASAHDQDDICDENAAAGVLDLDEAFPTGDLGPPAHPNCACDLVPVVGDAKE